MDWDYSKRSYLLPEGCKDLIDAIQPKTAITGRGFVVTLEERQSAVLKITVEGNILRITRKQVGSHAPFESTIQVPSGYAAAGARAIYYEGHMRIVVPKAAA